MSDRSERLLCAVTGSLLLFGAGVLSIPYGGRVVAALTGVLFLALVGSGQRRSRW